MTYRIKGLDPADFAPLFAMRNDALAARRARRVTALDGQSYPCRVSLREAAEGERLILVNHVSMEAESPYRASHAIYVREDAEVSALFEDELPPMLARRVLSLRAFDAEGTLRTARLAMSGEGDAAVRALLDADAVETVHAHNAATGCFLAAVERS